MNKTLTAAIAAATFGLSGAALADPVYIIATITVNDWESFNADYAPAAVGGIFAAGGELLVATPEATVVEGSYDHNWTVVVRFPSQEAATGFYESADYQAVLPVRLAATNTDTSVLVMAPQFVPPAE